MKFKNKEGMKFKNDSFDVNKCPLQSWNLNNLQIKWIKGPWYRNKISTVKNFQRLAIRRTSLRMGCEDSCYKVGKILKKSCDFLKIHEYFIYYLQKKFEFYF